MNGHYDKIIADIEMLNLPISIWRRLRVACGLKKNLRDTPRAHIIYLRGKATNKGNAHARFHAVLAIMAEHQRKLQLQHASEENV